MENIEKTLKDLKALFNASDMVITGSTALFLLGLLPDEGKDIDIFIVRPTEDCLCMLKKLNVQKEYPDDGQARYSFTLFGKKIDFFIVDAPCDYIQLYNDIKVATPMSIVRTKKKYGRLKDIRMLWSIANSIMSQDFINNWVKG